MSKKSPEQNQTENSGFKKSEPDQAWPEEGSERPELEFISREALEARLNEAEEQVNILRDQFLRAQAEAQNVQKRYEKKIADVERYAIQAFAKELLVVIDNFERAISEGSSGQGSLLEGVQRTHELFLKVFGKFGLMPVDPQGESFNPELHEAISTAPAENAAQVNKVVQVLQKGYLLNERLIRPALVIVAKVS